MSYNVLILSAGRRVELIQCFKKAAKSLGISSRVVAADLTNTAPALYFADSFYIIPRIGTEGYIEAIIQICKLEDIRLIVPTIDTELLLLSQNKQYIQSTTNAIVLVSNYSVISYCRDKLETQKFFEQNNFGVPKIITQEQIKDNNVAFPLFLKPRDGSSSINTFKINNIEELVFFQKYVPNNMVQKFVDGEEFTVDTFLDFESNIITIVPRKRMATRSGEISKGQIVKDIEIINDIRRLLSILKPIGQITIQCMKTDHGIVYMEINPRFGGGAPMSIMAGADSCANLYRLLMGQSLKYNEDYNDNSLLLRFDKTIMLNDDMELVN